MSMISRRSCTPLMTTSNLPQFAVGQRWQCRDQSLVAHVQESDDPGHCRARIYSHREAAWVHTYMYSERCVRVQPCAYPVFDSHADSADLMCLIYCPTWNGEPPNGDQ